MSEKPEQTSPDQELQRLLGEAVELRTEIETKKSTGADLLRLDQAFVTASQIAEQYFCEKKLEMVYERGEIETEPKRTGSEGHETLQAESIPSTWEEVFQKVMSGGAVVAQELPLIARHDGLVLAGRPDIVVFKDRQPLLILECKFTKSRTPQNSHHVQAGVYAKLLENMGFDSSQLRYVIALVSPELKTDPTLFTRLLKTSTETASLPSHLEFEGGIICKYDYDSELAVANIEWALEYWKGNRDAIPTRNPNKCRSCEYSKECPSSLASRHNDP